MRQSEEGEDADDREDVDDGTVSSLGLVLAHDGGERADRLPVVVYFHERGGDAASALTDARALFGRGPDIVAPQAARPCNPFQSNLRAAPRYAGFSWYLGENPSRPEAASFGDALAQLELVARDLGRPFLLAGSGQGAVLAVTLALFAPGGLAGVHARGAALPDLDGWPFPLAMLPAVELALVGLDPQSGADAVAVFTRREARTFCCDDDSLAQRERWLQSLAVANMSNAHG
jgi:hypothetical protein